MKASQDLARKMAETTNEDLLAMFARPDDWTPEALEAARIELRKRNVKYATTFVPDPVAKHTGFFRWRTWSVARKGMIIGALIAALVTVCVDGIMMKTWDANDPEGRSLNYLVGIVYIPITMPTVVLYVALHYIFGWAFHGDHSDLPTGLMCLSVVVNSFIGAVLGGVIGYSGRQVRRLFRGFGWVKDIEQKTQPAELYHGPRCVRCNEPVSPGIDLCPKCGWTQPR